MSLESWYYHKDEMVLKVNVDIEKKETSERIKSFHFRVNYRVILFYVIDILLVTASFLLFIWMKPASLRFTSPITLSHSSYSWEFG
ncbi:MAG: hypothetical protein IPH84_06775 [Bacteroidales bacterium]|nr:hypothetical protein [Bacteroidales bacterium]